MCLTTVTAVFKEDDVGLQRLFFTCAGKGAREEGEGGQGQGQEGCERSPLLSSGLRTGGPVLPVP